MTDPETRGQDRRDGIGCLIVALGVVVLCLIGLALPAGDSGRDQCGVDRTGVEYC